MPAEGYPRRAIDIGTLDLQHGQVQLHTGEVRPLTDLECDLLRYLAERSPDPVGADELYREVWSYAASVSSRALDKTVNRLRKKLELNPRKPTHLVRLTGVGLALRCPVVESRTPVDRSGGGLVGREKDLAALAEQVSDSRLVTVVGPGGVGKTRLAEVFFGQQQERYSGGGLFVDLSRVSNVADMKTRLAWALEVSAEGVEGATLGLAIRARGELLVVLDNLEQMVTNGGALIAELLDATDKARFVVTSRFPLRAADERLLRLSGLEVADAVELFCHRANAVSGPRTWSAAERKLIAGIVEELEGLPLAIEMAAARTTVLTVAQITGKLAAQLDLLQVAHSRDTDHRHSSMRAAIAWSWELLGEPEQRALFRLGVLQGSFSSELGSAVLEGLGSPLNLMQRLVDYSLVQVVAGRAAEIRMRVPAMLRLFVDERWSQSPPQGLDKEAVQGIIAGYFSQKFEGLYVEGVWPDTPDLRREMLSHLEDLIRCTEQQQNREAATVCLRLAIHTLRRRGPLSRALSLLNRRLADLDSSDHLAREWLVQRSAVHRLTGNLDAAERDARRQQTLTAGGQDPRGYAISFGSLGVVQFMRGDFELARETLKNSVRLFDELDGTSGRTVLSNLGFVEVRMGNLEQARECYERASKMMLVAGDTEGEAAVLTKLCNLHWMTGDLERSRWYGERALAMHRQLQTPLEEAIDLGNLGTLHERVGELDLARQRFEEARAAHERIGSREGLAIASVYLASVAAEQGAYDEGRALLREALTWSYQLDSLPITTRVLVTWSRLERRAGEGLAALDLANRALSGLGDQTAGPTGARVKGTLALALIGLGQVDEARRYSEEVAETMDALGLSSDSPVGQVHTELSEALQAHSAGAESD